MIPIKKRFMLRAEFLKYIGYIKAQPMYILRKLHGQSSKCQVVILFFNVNGEGHSLISVGISIDMYGII